jgi:long-chain acyl-CoA synthetase
MTTDTTLREGQEIDAVVEGKTILDFFDRNAERFPDQPAILWKEGEDWTHRTWSQYHRDVTEAAAGLQTLGVEPGDFVAIMAGNRPEHGAADLAASMAGGTGVTIYSTFVPEQVQYVANNCEAKVAILENLEFMKNWESIKSALPHLTHVVMMEDADHFQSYDWVISWSELIERGREALSRDPEQVARVRSQVTPESLATLIYTSGTTGIPKGVMITQRNVVWTTESVRRAVEIPPNPRLVSYLPLAHIAERVSTHYNGIYLAGQVYFCPDMTQVLEYIQRARPEVFVGVPRVYEKFHTRISGNFAHHEKADLIAKALANAVAVISAEQEGRNPGLLPKLKMVLFDKLVFSKVRAQLGMDEVVVAITAAAPISRDLIVFFNAIGIPLHELYGMSENTGPATTNRPGHNKMGSVGTPLPGVEVKLGPDGEVLMRGGIVTAGYYKMDEESRETFDPDGWLHSGDLGKFDEDGFLSIVGRKKEIIITAAGKNVAPAKLETLVKEHALVAQACMIGDARKFLTMLIALDAEEAPAWAKEHGLEFTDLQSFANDPQVQAEIAKVVDEANSHVSQVEKVKRFTIVPDNWTPDSGEITPSLKLKRRVVLEKYADTIEEMYAGAGSD